MKHVFTTVLTILILTVTAFSQEKYYSLIKQADSLFELKQYGPAAGKYKLAFDEFGGKAIAKDRYQAARSYALAGIADSSFYHLFRLANDSNYNSEHFISDKNLVSLYVDKRWEVLTALVRANKKKAEANYNWELKAILDSIYITDQEHRLAMDSIDKKYGWESKEMQALGKIMNETDSLNVITVSKILDKHGWLGKDIVGTQGSKALFLVIQHASDLRIQLKYLPMMKRAAKDGKLNPANLALLEDRVELRQGKLQIYGSQIGRDQTTGEFYVEPMIDPDNVNKRRAEVGLGSIEEYASIWKIKWDVEAYKKKLPELIKKQKKW